MPAELPVEERNLLSVAEELKMLTEATQTLQLETGGAEGQAYSPFQESSNDQTALQTRALSAIMKFGAGTGEDPFAKVKGLITALISRLQDESSTEANQKAYCDEETSKATEKEENLEDDIAKRSSKLETAVQSELFKKQLQTDTMLADERQIFAKSKADLEP